MISEKDLQEIIRLQKLWIEELEQGIPREAAQNIPSLPIHFALMIVGARRSGKSTLLRQILGKQKNVYYLNLEDPRLTSFSASDFLRVERIFKQDFGSGGVYFFDEIQNIERWESFIRYLVDKGEKVVLTGSNASLLSRELGTKLTGRHMNVELFPFSYTEFLTFSKMQASLQSYERFLLTGGFPEFLKQRNPAILNELLNDILMRDIVTRFGIRNSDLLKRIALYLLSHVGKEFSFNSLKKMFQVKSVQAAIDYVSYFEDSYLLFTVSKFSYSYKKQQISPKKVYSIDTGLSHVNSVSFSKDQGKMLENSVFLHLKRRYPEIFYFQGEKECDFIVKEKEKVLSAIQVCWELHEENRERELGGLQEAMGQLKLSEGLIVTFNQEDSFELEGKKIKVLPAWKWMAIRERSKV